MMDRRQSHGFRSRWTGWLVALAAGTAMVSACTSGGGSGSGFPQPQVVAGALRLVAFESCDETMGAVKAAAKQAVGPYGFGGAMFAIADRAASADVPVPQDGAGAAPFASGAESVTARAPAYSGTNVHEAGVDEPDIVKTDGRRIVTVKDGALFVVDPATKRITGKVQVAEPIHKLGPEEAREYMMVPTDLLIAGDRALLLTQQSFGVAVPDVAMSGTMPVPPQPTDPDAIIGPRMVLVDIGSPQPRVLGTYAVDGSVLDARQVGSVARIVVQSAPRIMFPFDEEGLSDDERLRRNRDLIDKATADDWLPRYEVTEGGTTSSGRVDCAAVSRPPRYSGAGMLTVLTFDLAADRLGNGRPMTIMADGSTVYSTGERLYIAHDQRWWSPPMMADAPAEQKPRTEIYQLDIEGSDPPRYAASGVVPGWLINQYAMSEWDGHLRVATTTDQGSSSSGGVPETESAVYVLRQDHVTLRQVGHVGGLGKGEQIYAVRFVGPLGYVVTFRQVDPLYTVDLRDPEHPALAGELKITGYSSYLHPVGDDRILGVGQEATEDGRILGLQVSLFDVENPAAPTRIAQHHIEFGSSEAEYDPHAFLYWPDTGLLVLPVTTWNPVQVEPPVRPDPSREPEPMPLPEPVMPQSAALALTVQSGGFVELGMVTHPQPPRSDAFAGSPQIRRSLVIGDALWTLSDTGLKANDVHTLDELAFIPFR